MNKKHLSISAKRSVRRFRKERAEYFDFLADVIEGSDGKIKFLQIFENDAERYAKKPRGILSKNWRDTFSENGASLSTTWRGVFPDDELALLNVAQESGDGAIITTLRDVASGARLKQEVENKALITTIVGGFAASLAFLMLTIYPIFVSSHMIDTFSMVPEEYWKPLAKKWFAYSEFIELGLPFIVIAFVFVIFYVRWTVNNLVGEFREWLDCNNFFYRTIRDTKAVMFLTTLATIAKQRGASSLTLKKALVMFQQSSRSQWFNWRIRQIIDNIDRSGALSSEVFNTNIISEEVFFYLNDMEQARGFSVGFSQTAEYMKTKLLAKVEKKLRVYLYVTLAISGVLVFSVSATQMAVLKSMTSATKSFYSDNQR